MQLTRYTDYSLRVLIYVGLRGEKISTIREIADAYGISKNHLMKVVQELNVRGYIVAIRGKMGGIKLNGRPEDLNLGRLIRDMEPTLALVECFSAQQSCILSPACRLKGMLKEAMENFFATMESYTLADALRPEDKPGLIAVLGFSDSSERF